MQLVSPERKDRVSFRPEVSATATTMFIFLGLVGVAAILSKGVFLQPKNLLNLMYQNVILGVVALGQYMVVLTSGIDLSVGSMVGISSVLLVLYQDAGPGEALAIALAGAVIIGLLNGALVTYQRLPAFVVTLATSQIGYSLAQIVSGGAAVYRGAGGAELAPLVANFNKTMIAGMPAPFIMWLLAVAGVALYMRTSYGHFTYTVGGNERAAYLSGLPVHRVKMLAYMLAGLLGGLGGLLSVARVGMGDPQAGTSYVLDTIAAVTIGGASLSGGRGSVAGTFLGVLILGTLNNISNLLNISPSMQPAVKGLVILLAVFLGTRRNRS